MNRLATLFVFCFLSPAAFADVTEEIVACSNVGNTIEINECAAGLATREEARMRDELAKARAVLRRVEEFFAKETPRPTLVRPLLLAQAAWSKYRNTECGLAVQLAMGGSVRGLNNQGCLAALNAERANRLHSLRIEYEALGY